MDLETRKTLFVQKFLRLQNEEAISRFEELMEEEREQMLQENLKPMLSTRLDLEIESSLNDSENDRVTRARDLKKRIHE